MPVRWHRISTSASSHLRAPCAIIIEQDTAKERKEKESQSKQREG